MIDSLLAGPATWAIGALLACGVAALLWQQLRVLRPREAHDYQLGVIAAMANESRYVREWVAWHREQGFDRFFIYDNDAVANDYQELFGDTLLPYITIEPWAGVEGKGLRGRNTPQRQAYNHAMKKHAAKCRYVMICDIDEFAMPAPGSKHDRVCEVLGELPRDAAWIEITRRDFGHRPHQQRPAAGVVESYVWRSASQHKNYQKTLVRGSLAPHLYWLSVHRPRWRAWVGRRTRLHWRPFVDEERHLRINHYYTKSAEEWKERGQLWQGNRFNKENKLRAGWDDDPPAQYSEAEDTHARELARRLAARSSPADPPDSSAS